ncbi:hypothetical protein BC939DRAFT_437176 [Gamsiella multidivaricata]|uniref:uncharacterized protein n=1 Tax=Gamsiella multidivaricata TaxID=101098 RepID=UPI00221ECD85|nr:uncharacterized protein BC939DRAFT_437176 [Gamsiella multidivaricata]KAG0366220.1 hypothetical protein BGZ54_005654 [Gamsiella multidivaricata]KAI7831474.1 hypothetical protein BC939DRAFT_437176 [Gamsiella multidivaricata]
MSTSTLQLLPTTATEIAQLDPATLASIPGVAYDLKRLKVYSSCLRCRAKKVKCDRKEPCSRCEKHNVECSYRELASVQLDIRQFQRHLTNPRIRKDGAGIITSTATPIITLPSGDTAVLSPSTTAAATLIAAAKATALTGNGDGNTKKTHGERRSAKSSSLTSTSIPASPVESSASKFALESTSSTDTESDTPTRAHSSKAAAMARAKVNKLQRRKFAAKVAKRDRVEFYRQVQADDDMDDDDDDDEEEEIERVVLRDNANSAARRAYAHAQSSDVNMSSESEDDENNIPIWKAQAVGKHKQTAHEQELAETFGLAAYLKAKEMESGQAGQTIDYDIELERALVQRLPTSFSRPDRSLSRARKYAQAGYNPSLPYARPSYCQLSSLSSAVPLPVAAHCCCQIAAKQGQAPGTCYFSGNTNRSAAYDSSSMSPPPQTIGYDQGDSARIQYSPSCQPSYTPKDETATAKPDWSASSPASSMMPPPLAPLRKLDIGATSASTSPLTSPRIELPPIYLPRLPPYPTTPASSDLSRFQVGRDGDAEKPPLEIACKYNEPNVDAWDMIEKPISRTVPVTTKRGRSVKMEMGWILS